MGFYQERPLLLQAEEGLFSATEVAVQSATALLLLMQRGCKPCYYRQKCQKLEDAKEELERLYGVNVLPIQADVSKDGDNEKVVRNVVDRAVETFGGIDVLINNAQASASGITLADHTTEQFDLAVYSGLYATFYYMKACYPYLKNRRERL